MNLKETIITSQAAERFGSLIGSLVCSSAGGFLYGIEAGQFNRSLASGIAAGVILVPSGTLYSAMGIGFFDGFLHPESGQKPEA